MIGGEATIHRLSRHIAELRQERDELAAHVERLSTALEGMLLEFPSSDVSCEDRAIREGWQAFTETPATSLFHRDLIKQAEALEGMADAIEPLSYGGTSLRNQANKLRQQAEAQQ